MISFVDFIAFMTPHGIRFSFSLLIIIVMITIQGLAIPLSVSAQTEVPIRGPLTPGTAALFPLGIIGTIPGIREISPIAVSGALPGPQFLPIKNVSEPVKAPETLGSTPWLLRYVINPLARAATRSVLTALTQQVVNWISADGGNNVGFVGNFEKTLTNELDDRAGEFLQRLDLIDFCGDIGAYLKVNLRAGGGGLRQRAKCSLSAIVSNVQNFYDNFQNGGWEAFLKVNTDIQNNTAGAFLIALDAKIAAETRRKEEFGARYNKSSILGVGKKVKIDCVPIGNKKAEAQIAGKYQRSGVKEIGTENPDEKCFSSYEEQTPGVIIEQTIKDANRTGIDFGISAKEFDEAIGAIMTALLQRTISSVSGIFGNSGRDYGGRDVGGKDIYNYKEIGSSQDALRSRTEASIFLAYGTEQAIHASVLALRRELTASPAPNASREREIKERVAELLAKKQPVTTEKNQALDIKLSSFATITQGDITRVDALVTQSMNNLEPIAQQVGATPYASPTGDLKTDALNNLSGSRTSVAGLIGLVNQAIAEIDRAIPILNARIAAAQAELATLQPQLSALRAQLATSQSQLSTLQSQLASFQSQLATRQSQRDTLQSQLASLQVQLQNATSQAQAATIQQQINAIQQQISTLQGQITTTQGQINAVQAQIDATQTQVSATQGQIDATQTQVSTTQTQITTTGSRIDALNAQIAADQDNILKLIDHRAALTTGDPAANQKGVLAQLHETDAKLQSEYATMQKFVTISEVVGRTGIALGIMTEANTIQTSADVAVQNVFGFLDSIIGNVLTQFQPASPPAQTPAIPPPIEEAPLPQQFEDSNSDE